MKVVPGPPRLSNVIVPPCSWMQRFTMAMPRPVPGVFANVVAAMKGLEKLTLVGFRNADAGSRTENRR